MKLAGNGIVADVGKMRAKDSGCLMPLWKVIPGKRGRAWASLRRGTKLAIHDRTTA